MSELAYAVTVLLFLSLAVMGVSGCAATNLKSPSQEIKAFFVAGNETDYLGLKGPSSSYVDLSAYSHLMGIQYPPTLKVDVLSGPPLRPYKSFAVLEYEPADDGKTEGVLAGLKEKAREIGADAIILGHPGLDRGLPGMPPTSKVQALAVKYQMTSASE